MVLVLGKEGRYHQASGILEGWGCCVKESGLECTSKNVANGRIPSAPIIAPVPICHQSARGCVCVWVQNLVLLCRVAFSALSCDNVSGGVYLCLFCFSIFHVQFHTGFMHIALNKAGNCTKLLWKLVLIFPLEYSAMHGDIRRKGCWKQCESSLRRPPGLHLPLLGAVRLEFRVFASS